MGIIRLVYSWLYSWLFPVASISHLESRVRMIDSIYRTAGRVSSFEGEEHGVIQYLDALHCDAHVALDRVQELPSSSRTYRALAERIEYYFRRSEEKFNRTWPGVCIQ